MENELKDKGQDPGEEVVLDDIIDLEEYAKRGERPPSLRAIASASTARLTSSTSPSRRAGKS